MRLFQNFSFWNSVPALSFGYFTGPLNLMNAKDNNADEAKRIGVPCMKAGIGLVRMRRRTSGHCQQLKNFVRGLTRIFTDYTPLDPC
ncbi:MAG: hypothetical protein LBT00_06320 [Spirochaetaceae bacterium]|jgi:hypothetical protein|nr:hypothetical protein [Spirochaetaceae bacterium]